MRCPELKAIQAGDEVYYYCLLTERLCVREYGQECEEYNKIMEEENDNNNNEHWTGVH